MSYLNHFTQPDSIIPQPGNPQSLNRYSYVLNSPLKFTDPTGHVFCDEFGTCHDHGETYQGEYFGNFYSYDTDESGGSRNDGESKFENSQTVAINYGVIYSGAHVGSPQDIGNLNTKEEEQEPWELGNPKPFMNPKEWGANLFMLINDMAALFAPRENKPYPDNIYAAVTWFYFNDGVSISSVKVTNMSEYALAVKYIGVTSFILSEQQEVTTQRLSYPGPKTVVWSNGDTLTYMFDPPVYATDPSAILITMQMLSVGGIPKYPSITTIIPSRGLPFGCSIQP